jgi:SAM-dependent methyltransferase
MGLRTRLLALTYDHTMAATERGGFGDVRAGLVAGAHGDVLEVGAGTGLNLGHYGPGVRSLTLTEPEPGMLRRLDRAARRTGRDATILRAPAEDLPFDDASFDTVVSTLVLCGVDDQARAAREIRRVLRSDGRLLFAEHVRSGSAPTARMQDRWNWLNRLVAGCECNRPTLQTLVDTRFAIGEVTHGELPKSPPFVRPLVVGTAHRSIADARATRAHESLTTSEKETPSR